jgi:hypothetical protein
MSPYEPTLFVEPLGYQPVEFLDIPPMHEGVEAEAVDKRPTEVCRLTDRAGRRPPAAPVGW